MLPQRKRFWAEVDLDVAKANYDIIRSRLTRGVKLCCVVKANAYGHGAPMLAKLYEELGADWFAVSNIEEAMQLRQHRIKKPILILGYTPPECAPLLSANNISQTVFSLDYARELESFAAAEDMQVKIHIKLDTGMGRLGFSFKDEKKDAASIDEIALATESAHLVCEGIFTHFAVADEGEKSSERTKRQAELFGVAVGALKERGVSFEIRHAAHSAAPLAFPETELDMVRAGIVLYGLSPSDADCSLRVSISEQTTESDIDTLSDCIETALRILVRIKR